MLVALADETENPPKTSLFEGRFTIERSLGEVQGDTVYLVNDQAHREALGSLAVRKIIRVTVQDRPHTAFLESLAAKALQLRHQNLISLFEVVALPGIRGFTYEWIEGISLAEYLSKHRLTPALSLTITFQLTVLTEFLLAHGFVPKYSVRGFKITRDGTIKLGPFSYAEIGGDKEPAELQAVEELRALLEQILHYGYKGARLRLDQLLVALRFRTPRFPTALSELLERCRNERISLAAWNTSLAELPKVSGKLRLQFDDASTSASTHAQTSESRQGKMPKLTLPKRPLPVELAANPTTAPLATSVGPRSSSTPSRVTLRPATVLVAAALGGYLVVVLGALSFFGPKICIALLGK